GHVMARRGAACENILGHYFPGTSITGEPLTSHAIAETDKTFAITPVRYYAQDSHRTLSSEHFHITYPAAVPPSEVQSVTRQLEAARLDMFARVGPASLRLP